MNKPYRTFPWKITKDRQTTNSKCKRMALLVLLEEKAKNTQRDAKQQIFSFEKSKKLCQELFLKKIRRALVSVITSSDEVEKILRSLCLDCQRRYETNPLRILDCSRCPKNFVFPAYHECWTDENQNYVKELNKLLDKFSFPYQYNYQLVRGLDYYTGLLFEINLGQEKSLLGGGRYGQLFQQLERIDLPAMGFAIGIDRLVSYCEKNNLLKINNKVDIFFLILVPAVCSNILLWKKELENSFLVDYNLNFKKKYNLPTLISHYQPRLLIIVDEKEKILIKDCYRQENFLVERDQLVKWVSSYLIKKHSKKKYYGKCTRMSG